MPLLSLRKDLLLLPLSTQFFEDMNKRIIGINAIVLLVILFALELVSGYVLSLKRFRTSSLIYAINKISLKIKFPESDKHQRVSLLRENGLVNAYPAYIFDPQVHESDSILVESST